MPGGGRGRGQPKSAIAFGLAATGGFFIFLSLKGFCQVKHRDHIMEKARFPSKAAPPLPLKNGPVMVLVGPSSSSSPLSSVGAGWHRHPGATGDSTAPGHDDDCNKRRLLA